MTKHEHTERCEWRAKGKSSNGARYCLTMRRERERVGVQAPTPKAPTVRLRSSKEGNCSGSTAQIPRFHSNPTQWRGRTRA